MAADNWIACPRCEAARIVAQAEIDEAPTKAYGKVSEEEYARLRKRAENFSLVSEDSMREDYDIGIRDGRFSVNYRAKCKCGFTFDFKVSERV